MTDFAALYGAIACGELLVEPRGSIVYANRAAETPFGLSASDMLGGPLASFGDVLAEDGAPLAPQARPERVALSSG